MTHSFTVGNAASMVNRVFCNQSLQGSDFQQLTTDTSIEVNKILPVPLKLFESIQQELDILHMRVI